MDDVIIVETGTLSSKEAKRVFLYLCKNVLFKKPKEVRQSLPLHLRCKNIDSVNFNHVCHILYAYGIKGTLVIEHVDGKRYTHRGKITDVDILNDGIQKLQSGIKPISHIED